MAKRGRPRAFLTPRGRSSCVPATMRPSFKRTAEALWPSWMPRTYMFGAFLLYGTSEAADNIAGDIENLKNAFLRRELESHRGALAIDALGHPAAKCGPL